MKPQAVGEIIITNSEYTDDLTKITSNDTLTGSNLNQIFLMIILSG